MTSVHADPGGFSAGGALSALAREARAVARLATLLPLDRGAVVPSGVQDGDDVVVLVHGLLATAGAFRPLRDRLERGRVARVASFTYGPGCGVTDVAGRLSELLTRLPARARVHLVGHSLGGLSIRWFVQECPGDRQIVQTISVAAPFEGARGARLLPGRAGGDILRGSDALVRLARTAAAVAVPHLSVLGAVDTAVHWKTRFPVGDRLVVEGTGHNGLLFAPEVQEEIVRRVRLARPGGPA